MQRNSDASARLILHPTDFSESARRAGVVAADIARLMRARLELLTVVGAPAHVAAAQHSLGELIRSLGIEGGATAIVRVGSPAEEIARFARECGADAVVVGSHGRTGFTNVLLGSVAERLARTSPVPVIVVPHDGRAALGDAGRRCLSCGSATEDLFCEPCRTRFRTVGPPEDHLAGAPLAGALDAAQIDAVLGSELIGRIGCHAEGRTYVVPIAYVYDGTSIFFRSDEGLKIRMMRENPRVCLQVDRISDLAHWESVIVWGTFHELHGDDAVACRQRILDRLASHTSEPEARPRASRTDDRLGHRAFVGGRGLITGRIDITEKSGRFEQR